jgi:hypothetical protein
MASIRIKCGYNLMLCRTGESVRCQARPHRPGGTPGGFGRGASKARGDRSSRTLESTASNIFGYHAVVIAPKPIT